MHDRPDDHENFDSANSSMPDVDDHLAKEHGLVKVTAYVPDERKAKRSGTHKKGAKSGAKRQRKHRAKLKQAGLKMAPIPESVAVAMKAAGSFEQWLQKQSTQTLTPEQRRCIGIGRRVLRTTGLRRWTVFTLIRSA